MRSLENPGKSRNMDMPQDPEGIYGRDKKQDEPLSFEEHMRELRRLKAEIESLPPDDLVETIKQNEEILNESRHLNSIGDFAKQDKIDKRARDVFRRMDEVGSFGNQYRNLANEERREKIEKAREKVLESFKESFDNSDNSPVNHNIADDSQINHSLVVDKENKPQMDYIPITDFSKKEPINMPSLELEEPISSMEKASPEDEAAYHEFQMEQILGQFFPKTKKHETMAEHRETSATSENLANSLANDEKSDVDNTNDEKIINEGHPDKEQIEQLRVQLSNYDSQIEKLISNMQPYMQIPKVNREISKVIERNNNINSSQMINSVSDYKATIEAKQSLIAYLEQANKFIKDNAEKTRKPIVEQQPVQTQESAQSLPDGFWDEFDKSQEKQIPTDQSFEEIMADFKNPDPTTVPEIKYNSDGTYTMEYIAHLANTPSGFNRSIYNQLMQENELKRKQNENSMNMLNNSETQSDY